MQPSVLRSISVLPWQQARGALPSALQQALAASAPSTSFPSTPAAECDAGAESQTSCSGRGMECALQRRAWVPLSGVAGLSTSARAAHAAVSQAAAAVPSGSTAAAAAAAAAAAPQGAYSVEIAVQGFEKRYVDMACNTLSDIIILAFAPKSFSALPTGAPSPSAAPVNLAFGPERRDVRLPWRRTRFTLIRGPHIDKPGMEQFERRQYKTVLTAATNCGQELSRLLEAVKLYQFTGVQIKMELTSAQRVQLPHDVTALLRGGDAASASTASTGPSSSASSSSTSTSSRSGGGSLVGSPLVDIPAPASAEAAFAAELGRVLGVLRPAVWAGLSKRRAALAGSADHEAWLKAAAPGLPAAASAAAGSGAGAAALPPPAAVAGWDAAAEAAAADGADAFGRLLRLRLRQQAQLHQGQATASTTPTPGTSAASAAAYGLDPAVAAQLLARIDAELLHAHEAAAAGLPPPAPGAAGSAAAALPPSAAAAAAAIPDAGNMSPAEYAYAVLKYVQYVDSLYEASGAAAAAARGDAGLQLAAPALAVRLLQLWWEATTVEFKRALGLPPAEEERRMLEKQLELQKRKEEVKGGGGGRGGSR